MNPVYVERNFFVYNIYIEYRLELVSRPDPVPNSLRSEGSGYPNASVRYLSPGFPGGGGGGGGGRGGGEGGGGGNVYNVYLAASSLIVCGRL